MNKGKTTFLIVSFCILSILVWGYHSILKFKEIDKKGLVTISKFCRIIRYPKSKDYEFCFYINKQKTTCTIPKIPNGFSSNVGKFYRIKYLEKYPDLIIVKFDEEVRDTTEILKAGFSKEDIIPTTHANPHAL